MSKLFYEALKKLPDEYIDDATQTVQLGKDMVVAVNAKLEPIAYSLKTGEWELFTAEGDGPIPKFGTYIHS